jgi:uncharacterized membrane protein HdeD (DUF308 family)
MFAKYDLVPLKKIMKTVIMLGVAFGYGLIAGRLGVAAAALAYADDRAAFVAHASLAALVCVVAVGSVVAAFRVKRLPGHLAVLHVGTLMIMLAVSAAAAM